MTDDQWPPLDEYELERDEAMPEDDQDFDWPNEHESIYERSERRSDEVLRWDGDER